MALLITIEPITGVRLKDGTLITVDPSNPREARTISQTPFWLTVRCRTHWGRCRRHGPVRRIAWSNVANVCRATEDGNRWDR
ncbi:hypothetical protein ACIPJG_25430 [Streptomyces halstedii]|uniref:hypothetical protein n=1 Tax=Streptomyces halstedii TaxID=1944 RepID=UPI0037F102E7